MTRANSKWVGVSVIVRRGDLWLLHERRDGAGCDAGLWGAPGGVVERGESYEQAAVRETREETMCQLVNLKLRKIYDLPQWVVFVVRGELIGEPQQPNGEIHKSGPWSWLSSAQVGILRDTGRLQGGLERYFRAEGMP